MIKPSGLKWTRSFKENKQYLVYPNTGGVSQVLPEMKEFIYYFTTKAFLTDEEASFRVGCVRFSVRAVD